MSTFRKPKSSTHSQPRSLLVLDSFLENSADSPDSQLACPFVVIEDCRSQSGLPVLKELINRAAKTSQNVVVCTTTIDPAKLIGSSDPHDQLIQSRCRTLDLTSFQDHPQNQHPEQRDVVQSAGDRIQMLINELATRDAEVPTTVVIDSVPECVRSWTLHQSFKLFRRILQFLPNARSRLVVLDSPHLHTTSPLSSLDPTPVLRSLSSSHLHLKIHPTCLLNHLLNAFGLPLPFPSSQQPGTHYDLRLFPLLDELAAACLPYANQQDGPVPVPQALLVASDSTVPGLGSCVVEWTSKNLAACNARPSASVRARPAAKGAGTGNARLASVQHGLEALKLEATSEPRLAFRLSPVALSAVLTQKTRTLTPVPDQDRSNPTKVDPLQGQLTFNLSLTDKQRAAREAVALPFLPRRAEDGTVIEAPGDIYDGSFQDPESRHKSGMILYEPDSADDMDDEEPDDEL